MVSSVSHTIKGTVSSLTSIISSAKDFFSHAGGLFKNSLTLGGRSLFSPALLRPSAQVLAQSQGKISVVLVEGSFSNSITMADYYKALEKADILTCL